jgi:hypothetical protein
LLERILDWTYLHVRPAAWAAPARVQFSGPTRTLKRGFGFCDQSAHVFCLLGREAGFRTRVYFLRDEHGVSPHAVAQVWLDGEWILVDTLAGRVLEAAREPITLDTIERRPAVVAEAYRGASDVLPLAPAHFLRGNLPYGDDVPWLWVPENDSPPQRPLVDQPPEVELYDRFREAALNQEWDRVSALYAELQTQGLPPDLAQPLGYHGALAAFDAGDWHTARQRCLAAIAADPQTPWLRTLYELLGRSYERLGDVAAALEAYEKADLPATRARLRALISGR